MVPHHDIIVSSIIQQLMYFRDWWQNKTARGAEISDHSITQHYYLFTSLEKINLKSIQETSYDKKML